MRNIDDFYSSAQESLNRFSDSIKPYDIKSISRADHLCYKCSSSESFEGIRRILENNSKFVYQSIISNRRIAIIKLNLPLNSILGNIDVIELSDQKSDNSQTEGFDHVEAYPVHAHYEELVGYLEKKGFKVKKIERPHHTTHDVETSSGILLRLTRKPLINKIKRDEMN